MSCDRQGYLVVADPDRPALERDACQCGHCQRIMLVKPGTVNMVYLFPQVDGTVREEMGAFCRVCMSAVCLQCHDLGVCVPAEKRIELFEAMGRRG